MTGVQTCALPILHNFSPGIPREALPFLAHVKKAKITSTFTQIQRSSNKHSRFTSTRSHTVFCSSYGQFGKQKLIKKKIVHENNKFIFLSAEVMYQ